MLNHIFLSQGEFLDQCSYSYLSVGPLLQNGIALEKFSFEEG